MTEIFWRPATIESFSRIDKNNSPIETSYRVSLRIDDSVSQIFLNATRNGSPIETLLCLPDYRALSEVLKLSLDEISRFALAARKAAIFAVLRLSDLPQLVDVDLQSLPHAARFRPATAKTLYAAVWKARTQPLPP